MPVAELANRPRTPTVDAVSRLTTLVSPYTGIVRSVEEFLHAPDEPRLIKIGCEPTCGPHLLGAELGHLEGGGGGEATARGPALAAAIGEVVERYSAAFVPEDLLAFGTVDEIGPAGIDPARFALFSPEQYREPGFPFAPFTRELRVSWAAGFALPGGRRAFVPAQLVYLSPALAAGEVRIGHATSSGLACGASLEEAILGGLLELVERDAFVLAWSNRLSLPLLDWRADPALSEVERRYFAPAGVRYRVVDLSVFLGIPTALAVVRGGSDAALGVGACSAATIGGAWLKALGEAFAVRSWARTMRLVEPARRFREDFGDVATFADHVHFYADPRNARRAAFLDGSAERRDVRDVSPLQGGTPLALIEEIAQRLATAGAGAYAVDVTAPDIRQAGLHVAKVVAPELCQLDAAFAHRFLGGTRLYRAAWELGLRPAPLTQVEVNPYPHPFP